MAVTLQQIADQAGVSRGTVDRALNHRGRINPEVAARVQRIAAELGYVPKRHRQTAPEAGGKQKIRLGVITALSSRVFVEKINHGIEQAREELQHWDMEILVRNGLSMDEKEQLAAIDELVAEQISGLIIMPIDCEAVRRKINELTDRLGIPVVTLSSDIIGTRRSAFIGIDDRQSGQTAAELMAKLTRGTGNILIITGFLSNYANSSRVDGFIEVIKNRYPQMKIAGVHCCFDDAAELESILTHAMLGTMSIAGIFVVSSGQAGIETAFQKLGMERRPYVIVYDKTPCTEQALKDDSIDFVIDQNCFSQGYQAAYALANLLTGQQEVTNQEHPFTDINIKTKYNI